MRTFLPLIALGLSTPLLGCQHAHPNVHEGCWDAQPTPIDGTLFVAPPLVSAEAPSLNLEGFLGEKLQDGWADGRIRRTAQLSELPYALSDALPGQLYQDVLSHWEGHFRPTQWDKKDHQSLLLKDPESADFFNQLSAEAKKRGSGGTLFVWVTHLDGHPLTSSTMSGELIFHKERPVLVDRLSEPYHVEIALGAALFDGSGHLAFRYQDHYESLLSESQDTHNAAKELAKDLASDLALIWPTTPIEHKRRLVSNRP